MNIADLFESGLCVRAVETLVHFLWQGLVIACLAAFVTRCCRQQRAAWRYWVNATALLAMLACPLVTFPLLDASPNGSATSGPLAWVPVSEEGDPGTPARRNTELEANESPPSSVLAGADSARATALPPNHGLRSARRWTWLGQHADRMAPFVCALYLVGVAAMFLRLACGLAGGRRLRRASRPANEPEVRTALARQARRIGLHWQPLVAWSDRIAMPVLIGLLKPTLLVPVALASQLTPQQLEAVLSHELAHIRRYDHIANLVQRLIEAVLFFHPAVWYLSHCISREREHCCDDLVLAHGAEPTCYAETLVRTSEVGQQGPAMWTAALVSLSVTERRGSRLRQRVLRILGEHRERPIRLTPSGLVLMGTLTVMCLLPLLLVAGPTEDEDTPTGGAAETAPVAAASEGPARHFKRVVIGKQGMTFEGEATTWDELPDKLGRVTNRPETVLELAIATEQLTIAQLNEARGKASRLSRRFDFEYLSYIGVHPLNSKGSPSQPVHQQSDPGKTLPTSQKLSVSQDGQGDFDSIQKAIDAASAGTVIQIGPGRFVESLRITKPLVLVGAGWNQTTIGPDQPAQAPNAEAFRRSTRLLENASSQEEKERIQQRFMDEHWPPAVLVDGAEGVHFRDLQLTLPGVAPEGRLVPYAVLDIRSSSAEVTRCAVVGSPGNGIQVRGASSARIQATLVAGLWNTGIVVGGDNSEVEVVDCDVRNCYYSGIKIGRNAGETTIRRCRISGAAWHGIRYDDTSPTIANNLIFQNARSGIYASGTTKAKVVGNVFFANEMCGISCWFKNRDTIERNSFIQHSQVAISVLGQSVPRIQNNVFSNAPQAVMYGAVSSKSPDAAVSDTIDVRQNIFWEVEQAVVKSVPSDEGSTAQPVTLSGNQTVDPAFEDVSQHAFSLTAESPARQAEIGVADSLPWDSPWSLQQIEQSMIPTSETRDSTKWRRPE